MSITKTTASTKLNILKTKYDEIFKKINQDIDNIKIIEISSKINNFKHQIETLQTNLHNNLTTQLSRNIHDPIRTIDSNSMNIFDTSFTLRHQLLSLSKLYDDKNTDTNKRKILNYFLNEFVENICKGSNNFTVTYEPFLTIGIQMIKQSIHNKPNISNEVDDKWKTNMQFLNSLHDVTYKQPYQYHLVVIPIINFIKYLILPIENDTIIQEINNTLVDKMKINASNMIDIFIDWVKSDVLLLPFSDKDRHELNTNLINSFIIDFKLLYDIHKCIKTSLDLPDFILDELCLQLFELSKNTNTTTEENIKETIYKVMNQYYIFTKTNNWKIVINSIVYALLILFGHKNNMSNLVLGKINEVLNWIRDSFKNNVISYTIQFNINNIEDAYKDLINQIINNFPIASIKDYWARIDNIGYFIYLSNFKYEKNFNILLLKMIIVLKQIIIKYDYVQNTENYDIQKLEYIKYVYNMKDIFSTTSTSVNNEDTFNKSFFNLIRILATLSLKLNFRTNLNNFMDTINEQIKKENIDKILENFDKSIKNLDINLEKISTDDNNQQIQRQIEDNIARLSNIN